MRDQGSQGVLPTEELHQIEGQVREQLRGRLQNFLLTAAEQGLILQGRSRTYYAKQMAQQIVMERTRQRIQANHIEVL